MYQSNSTTTRARQGFSLRMGFYSFFQNRPTKGRQPNHFNRDRARHLPSSGTKGSRIGSSIADGNGHDSPLPMKYPIPHRPLLLVKSSALQLLVRSQPSGREPFTPPIFILWIGAHCLTALLLLCLTSFFRSIGIEQIIALAVRVKAVQLRYVLLRSGGRLLLLLRFFQGGGLSWLLEACSMRCPSVPWKRFPLIFLTKLSIAFN